MRTDGRTDEKEDINKLIVAARNFANSSKNATKTQIHFVNEILNFYLETSSTYSNK